MDELLGFVVLSGPLLPILIWLTVSILMVTYIVKPAGNIYRRVTIKLLIFFIVFLLPFLDEIVGQVYLKYLCETQGGFKVYQTVELPDEYWDEDGEPNFIEENGNYHLGVMYPIKYTSGSYSSIFNIDNAGYSILNSESGDTLAMVIDYRFWGGWIRRGFSIQNIANTWKGREDRSMELMRNVFIK